LQQTQEKVGVILGYEHCMLMCGSDQHMNAFWDNIVENVLLESL